METVELEPSVPVSVEAAPVDLSATAQDDPRDVIARIAYGYWEARGYQGGDALEDWVRAEEEYRRLPFSGGAA